MTMGADEDKALSRRVREHATRHAAGPQLRAAVRTQVALHAAAQARPRPQRPHRSSWTGVLAGVLCGVLLTLAFGPWIAAQLRPVSLPSDLVASHFRALSAGPLFEVASSDRHTVKPWFQGRLDFAPPVPDLAAQGFVLQGGRVDRVQGHAAAALVYLRHKHLINVFVWPDEQAPGATSTSAMQRGYALRHWTEGAMQVWAVSDIEAAELARFESAWQARPVAPATP